MNQQIEQNFMKPLLSFFALCAIFISCSKSPGVGGKSTVSGKLHAIYVDEGSFDTVEISAFPDQRVYIVYGDGSAPDDDVRTGPNGSFKFEYLNPGAYSVYTYSESLLAPSELDPVYKSVTVNKKQDDIDLGILYVIKYVK